MRSRWLASSAAAISFALVLTGMVASPALAVPSPITITSAVIERDVSGALNYDVDGGVGDLTSSGVCVSSYPSCTLLLQGRLADDFDFYNKPAGFAWNMDWKTFYSWSFPGTFEFDSNRPVPTIDAVRWVLVQGSSQVESAWVAVDDPYPFEPSAGLVQHAVGGQPSGDWAFDITAIAEGFRIDNKACGYWTPTTNCALRLEAKFAGGTTDLIASHSVLSLDPTSYDLLGSVLASKVTSAGKPVAIRAVLTSGSSYVDVVGPWVPVSNRGPKELMGGGNPSMDGCQCHQADPVNTLSGEFFLPVTDLSLPGVGPAVAISRTYSTLGAADDEGFGYGWAPSAGARLNVSEAGDGGHPLPYAVEVVQENGSVVPFAEDDGEYPSEPWARATLAFDDGSDEWTFTRRHNEILVFDSDGDLLSFSDRHGNEVEYDYNGSGKLTSISGSGGREIELTWSGSRVSNVEDSAGREVTYAYDGSGNLIEATDATGAVWGYDYSAHLMTSLTRPEGGETVNEYDSHGRVISQTDPVGRETTFSYDTFATTTTLPDGSVTIETYSDGNVTSVTQAEGTAAESTSTFVYDLAGNMTSITDPLGNITTSIFDDDGNEVTTTDSLDRTVTRTFDPEGNVTSVEDPLGRLTQMTYDANGSLLSLTTAGQHEQAWSVNSDGTIATHTDARNTVTSYNYDSAGRPLCTTDPASRETCLEYDSRGFVVSFIDAGGAETTYTYDDVGRILTTEDPLGAITTTSYDDDGSPITVTDALANVTSMTYDAAGQLVTRENAVGGLTTYGYSDRGGIDTVTNPNGDVSTVSVDLLNRVTSATDGENRTTTYEYDLAGRLLTTVLPSSVEISSVYDDAGQKVTSTDALGKETLYDYNDAGELVSVVDPLSRETTMGYTDDGLIDTVTYPDESTEVHGYNANGQETSFTNADGKESTYSYGDSGLLVSKTEPGALVTAYAYDDAGRLEDVTTPDGHTSSRSYDEASRLTALDYQGGVDDVAFTYDELGNRLTMDDATGVTTYSYTDVSQVATVENGDGKTVAYDYDDAGKLLTITYPGNHDVDYTYDDAGEMTSVTGWSAGTTEYTYTADGYLQTREDPNGVTETHGYNGNGQVTIIETDVSEYTYAYDDAGQLTASELVDGINSGSGMAWGYDPLGQLTTVAPGHGYTATPAGLLLTNIADDELTYNTAGQLEGLVNSGTGIDFDFSFDDNGARIGQIEDYAAGPDHVVDYSYNEAGDLTGWDDGFHDIDYTIDGDGRRQSRTDNSVTSQFLWDTNSDLPLLLDDGYHTFIYGVGSTPIAQVGTAGVEFLYSDNIGSVRTVTNDTGAVVDTIDYDPYGIASIGTATAIGYTGAWTDPITRLVHLRERDYDPRTGQFLQADPLVSSTRAPYGYVRNNPLNATDPSGLIPGGCPPGQTCENPGRPFTGAELESIANYANAGLVGYVDGLTLGASAQMFGDETCTAIAFSEESYLWGYGVGSAAFVVISILASRGGGGPRSSAAEPALPVASDVAPVAVRPSGVPENWVASPSTKSGGVRYTDPGNAGNSVRVMPGEPNSPYPNSQAPYVRWQVNGKPLDASGNLLPSPKSPDAHIPLDQFKFDGSVYGT